MLLQCDPATLCIHTAPYASCQEVSTEVMDSLDACKLTLQPPTCTKSAACSCMDCPPSTANKVCRPLSVASRLGSCCKDNGVPNMPQMLHQAAGLSCAAYLDVGAIPTAPWLQEAVTLQAVRQGVSWWRSISGSTCPSCSNMPCCIALLLLQ